MTIASNLSTAGSAPNKIAPQMRAREIKFWDEKTQPTTIDIEKQESTANTDNEAEEDDIDALIEELESADPDEEVEQEIEGVGIESVPEEFLQTDPRFGLTDPEVASRRKKYGLNQMKEERENLFLKFLMYFVGPIQFVMEVSSLMSHT